MTTRASKEVRQQRAREIISQHPDWSVPRVSKALRSEFGTGLRWGVIQHARTGFLSKEYRAERAKTIIGGHPSWGKDRVNKELRGEFGVGLRRERIGSLKAEVLYVKPSRVERRYQTLVKEGFLPTEARLLSQNPITSPAMRGYRSERRGRVREYRKWGATKADLTKRLRGEYKADGHWEKGRIQPLAAFRGWMKDRKLPPEAARVPPRIRKAEMPPEAEWKPPRYMSYAQVRIYDALIAVGFLPFEAARIAGAPSMPEAWDTAPVQAAVQRRKEWVDWLRGKGWSPSEIRREIQRKYQKNPKLDPWDWIRQEYKPRFKIKDFVMATARRRQKMSAFGRGRALYGRRQRERQARGA